MSEFRKSGKSQAKSDHSAETAVLLFENAELRKTAAELMLQTAVLREALASRQAADLFRSDSSSLKTRMTAPGH